MNEEAPSGSAPAGGSYLLPRYDNARVADVMRIGVLTCTPGSRLRDVARTMSRHHIHCVVVVEGSAARPEQPWRLLTDVDLLRAIGDGRFDDLTARDVATEPALTVTSDDALERAVRLMTERARTHVVVVDGAEQPVGMLSTLDIATGVAWGL